MALIYRLLPLLVLVGALSLGDPGRANAAESIARDVLVPLGPLIFYVVPGAQPASWVPVSSKITLLVPGEIPEGATIEWHRNGELLPGVTGVQCALGFVTEESVNYYNASVRAPAGGSQEHVIQLHVFKPQTGSRIENCSLRGTISAENPRLIGGIVVGPQPGYAILVRAVGPALAAHGVGSPLPDPVLHFFDAEGKSADRYILSVTVAMVGVPTIEELVEAAGQSVGAFLLPRAGGDVAYLVVFPPGAFTAHVTSASGASGDVLLEFYDVPETPVVDTTIP